MTDRNIPNHVQTFNLTDITRLATTYHLRPDKGSGWALATINDETHELAIQSDWGNWAYRWSSSGMAIGPDGKRCSLTVFIAARDAGHCDYLADKLTSHEERHLFDSYGSVKEMRRKLIERRFEQGRNHIDYYSDCEPDERVDVGTDDPKRHGPMDFVTVRTRYSYTDEHWPLTKQTARALYDALGDLEGLDDPREFTDHFVQIDGYTWISDEPWNSFVYEPSPHYYQLLHGILPALVRACDAEVRRLGQIEAMDGTRENA
jgi:hypothetical protein